MPSLPRKSPRPHRRHEFKASEEFERTWPTLTGEQKRTVGALISWIDAEPLRGHYYKTDVDGLAWFASWLDDLGVIYRKRGDLIYVLGIHRLGYFLPVEGDDE